MRCDFITASYKSFSLADLSDSAASTGADQPIFNTLEATPGISAHAALERLRQETGLTLLSSFEQELVNTGVATPADHQMIYSHVMSSDELLGYLP
jgi:hypothetical protein